MSFGLAFGGRTQVAFRVPDEAEVEFTTSEYKCRFNNRTNTWFDMGSYALFQDPLKGNYSRWISTKRNQGVAVTGLTSCGAIFFANHDFSKIAAGHMSGDAQFVEDWCKLLEYSHKPFYLVFGAGPDGSVSMAGEVLMNYMKRFGIQPNCAPAVQGCSQIFVCRSAADYGVVYAQYGGNSIV